VADGGSSGGAGVAGSSEGSAANRHVGSASRIAASAIAASDE